MNIKRFSIGLILFFMLSTAVMAGNNFNSTPAVQGYDVVSYQNAKRPVRGNGNFVVEYNSAVYLFSSEENQKIFSENPDRYAPAYGGFCAYGVSLGKKFVADPEVWRVTQNKLYLNLDTSIQAQWIKDIPSHIKTANAQWKVIKKKPYQSL